MNLTLAQMSSPYWPHIGQRRLMLPSHWLREAQAQAGESTSERELRMCEDQSEDRKDTLRAFLFFLDSKYGNVTVASRLVSVRILT